MSEICILYTLFDGEKTVYSVRKDIARVFGAYSVPSHGTIYPSLKKAAEGGYVKMREFLSDGGRKSCCFSLTDKGKKRFHKLAVSEFSENPAVFLTDLKIRICAYEKFSEAGKKEFVKSATRKLELYTKDVEKRLNDTIYEPDKTQKAAYMFTKDEIAKLTELLRKL
ncbi:MAG: PadR family transcriptional regulator [Candidatus Gastranaerophilaceae bacterium]